MSVNIASLRSQLAHAISELHSVALADLAECKWPIKRRILTELFANCNRLQSFHQEIERVCEKHEEIVSKNRHSNQPREVKQECEQDFRTSLVRIFIEGLTQLRWPPALEAFSDPFSMLMNDREVFLDAVRFILDVAYTSMVPREPTFTKKASPGKTAAVPSPHLSPRSPRGDKILADDTSCLRTSAVEDQVIKQLDISAITVTTKGSAKVSRNDQKSNSTSRKDKASYGNDFHAMKNTIEVLQFQNEYLSKQLKQVLTAQAARDHAETQMTAIITELEAKINELAAISKGPEEVQKLAGMAHVVTPDETASFLDAVAQEEKKISTGVQSKLPVGSRGRTTYGGGSTSSGKATASQPRSSSGGESLGSVGKGPTSAVVWTHLAESIRAIQRRWREALKDVASVVTEGIYLLPETGQFLTAVGAAYNRISNKQQQMGTSASKRPTSTSSNAQRTNSRKFQHHEDAFSGLPNPAPVSSHTSRDRDVPPSTPLTSRSELKSSRRSGGGNESSNSLRSNAISFSFAKVSNNCSTTNEDRFETGGSSNQYSPTSILIHEMFGISAPLSWQCSSTVDSRVGLDLARVHSIQRDLLEFVNSVSALTENVAKIGGSDRTVGTIVEEEEEESSAELDASQHSGSQLFDPCPVRKESTAHQTSFQQLSLQAQNLVLHLSHMAPVIPLGLPIGHPLNCFGTGLELLQAEVSKNSSSQQFQRLQPLLDRALSEQITVVRALSQSHAMLNQWSSHSSLLCPVLEQFVKYSHQSITKQIGEVEELSDSLATVSSALKACETAKISLAPGIAQGTSMSSSSSSASASLLSSNKSSGNVGCPLNPLERGVFGTEVAELVKALRYFHGKTDNLVLSLKDISKKLKLDLSYHLAYFDNYKNQLLRGAQTTVQAMDVK